MTFGSDTSGHKDLRENPFKDEEFDVDQDPKSPYYFNLFLISLATSGVYQISY